MFSLSHATKARAAVLFIALQGCYCYHMPAPAPEGPVGGVQRGAQARDAAAVGITTGCLDPASGFHVWGGSGVVIDSTHVLTAYHVVACPGESVIRIDDKIPGIAVKVAPDADLAVVERLVGKWDLPPAAIGPKPQIGDVVCLVPVIPKRGASCGAVDEYDDFPGNVKHKGPTVPGNSGSGVYDQSGRLVGIVTHYRRDTVGGAFSSIEGRWWLFK